MVFILLLLFNFITISITQSCYNNISINNLSPDRGILITNSLPSEGLGNALKNIGDFNDDGIDDIAIAAYTANSTMGVVYIIFGNPNGFSSDLILTPNLSPNQGLIIYGANPTDMLGYALNNAGDINGDEIDDILIGAYPALSGRGVAYILYGSKNLPAIIDLSQGLDPAQGFAVIGGNPQDLLGIALSSAGDINNDEIGDIILGAPGLLNKKGAAYVIFGKKGTRTNITLTSSGLSQTEGFMILGASLNDNLGCSLSAIGDINSDGFQDVLIGAYGVNNYVGAVYVIFGKDKNSLRQTIDLSQGLSQSDGAVILNTLTSDYFGESVAGVSDFNGDGKSDFLVGAFIANVYAGAAYVFYGREGFSNFSVSSGLDPAKGCRIQGAKPMDLFGVALDGAGDINGDGIHDIIVGAKQANNLAGAAYIIFGSNNPPSNLNVGDGLDPQRGFAINGASTSGSIGTAVSRARDMNNDGMSDLLIAGSGFASIIFSPLVCPNTCITCTKTWICQACKPGYGLYNSTCITCPSSTKLVNGVCIPSKSPLETVTEVSKGLFDSSSTASRIFTMGRSLSVGLGLIAKIIQNVRYLNISYPEEALKAFKTYGTDLFEIPIPEILYKTPDTKELPIQYSRYDISPTFLENYWQTIMTIFITLACVLVIKFIQYLTRNQNKEYIFQVTLKNIGQTTANFLVIQIYSNLDDIIFYFLLDAGSTKLSSLSAGISLSSAAFFLLIGLALVFFHCWVLGKYQQAKRLDNLENFKNKFQIVGTLFEDFKDDNATKQSFFGILILRCVFLVLVIMLLQPPWIQASLLMLANLIFLGYFIHQRPFKSLFDEISQYFSELCVFAARYLIFKKMVQQV